MNFSIILGFLPFFVNSYSIKIDIPLDYNYCIKKQGEYDRIYLKNSIYLNNPGAPEMKCIVYTFGLPGETDIEDVRIVSQTWDEIPGEYYIFPEQKHYTLTKLHEFTEENPEIYNSETPYPGTPLITYKTGNLRGYKLCQFAISPFRYLPKSKRLMILKNLTLEIKTIPKITGIKPERQSPVLHQVFSRLVSSLAINRCESPRCYISDNPEDLLPTDLPSLLGPPVDLVIITTENLVQGYEKLAHLKKLLGYNTAIKTLSWIRQHYAGIDDADRIRNFIKDAVEKWGTGFILLGGDVPDIPTRWVWLTQVDYDQWPENVTTDLYFSCLDGNWNFDGDAKFGEVADSVDLYPDVFVGRLTLRHSEEVIAYAEKILKYHFPENPGIQTKTMFITSNLVYPNDAYELALLLAEYIPPWFVPAFLNEKPLQDFKDSIYAGYGVIQAIGHGDVNLWRVNQTPQYATNFFFDSLTNYDNYPLMITISCYTNPFQSDCLGEHFVNNSQGAGIAYIGPTGTSEGYLQTDLTVCLYGFLYTYPLASALGVSKIPYIPNSTNDSWYRYYLYSINLLGDPTILIWDSIPESFDTIVVDPDTLSIGIDTITITLTPPVDSFSVIYYKENEVFLRDTGLAGAITSMINTESSGYLKFTIISKRYVPHIDSIYVMTSTPYLRFDHFIIRDSLDNNNGILNPGEDIYLYVAIKNNGNSPADSITARIFCSDSFLNLIKDTTSYPVINPDSIGINLTPFHFKVSNSIPDEYQLTFGISMVYNRTDTDSFQMSAASPELRLFTQHCESDDINTLIFPYLENTGHCLADSVMCIISSLSDTVTVLDSLAYFPLIFPDSIEGIIDTLSLSPNYPGNIRYNFRAYYRGIEVINKNIRIQSLPAPDSFVAIGFLNSIGLKWKPVPGAIGYRIYRSTTPGGPYELIRNDLLRISYYEDFNVLPETYYYYYLLAVDSSMNEGLPGDTTKASINPKIAQGWPKTLYGYPYTSPNFGDLDPFYPGLEIATATRDDGAIYAWHYDGTPIVQRPYNDGRIFVAGGPLWASPAIGDINNDGKMDIVFGIRRQTNNLYVITSYDTTWLPMPGWPITVVGRIFSAPVLGDLDNNGDLEIIVRTEQADIYVFNHDGTGFFTPGGLLFDGPGSAYGAPSLGDINRDGNLEIVSCGGSGSESLYVWNRFGSYLSPFPIFIQSEKRLTCATVVGNIIGDDRMEIAFFTDSTRKVYLVSPDGNVLWSYALSNPEIIESYPVFADITGDEKPELICAESRSGTLIVFDSLGNLITNFPLISSEHDWRKIIAGDLNSDNISDLIIPANNWKVYGFNGTAQSIYGFPVEFGNYINTCPAIYDIDLDGRLELMVAPCDFRFYVFDLSTSTYEWPRFRYDQYNSGCYKSQNLVGITKNLTDRLLIPNLRLKVYPNPFDKNLTITLQILDSKSTVSIKIYDVIGRLVKEFDRLTNPGFHRIIWNGVDDSGRELSAGIYFIRLECENYQSIEKAILIK